MSNVVYDLLALNRPVKVTINHIVKVMLYRDFLSILKEQEALLLHNGTLIKGHNFTTDVTIEEIYEEKYG